MDTRRRREGVDRIADGGLLLRGAISEAAGGATAVQRRRLTAAEEVPFTVGG